MSALAKYTQGSLQRYLAQLSLPAMITIFMNLSFIAVDTVFLAHYSHLTLVAVSFCFPVITLFQMIANGLGIAAASVLSRYLGAGNNDKAQTTLITLAYMTVAIAALILPIIWLSVHSISQLLGASATYQPAIQAFLTTWFFGFLFVLVNFVGSNTLRVYGHPIKVARIQIISCLVNLALSPLLIFVFDWGIVGSALAGIMARLITSVWIIMLIRQVAFPERCSFSIQFSLFAQQAKAIFQIAIPAMMTNAIGPLATIFSVHVLARYGDNVVAGFGIASRIELLALVPLFALSGSVGPIIGQNFGATLFDRSYSALKLSFYACVLWGLIVTAALLIFGHALSLCFSHDVSILHVATLYLCVLPCSYASWGIIMMTNSNFNAIGKPLISTGVTCLRLGILFVPLCLLLGHAFGYIGIFIAFMLSNLLTSMLCLYLTRNTWRKRIKMQHTLPPQITR